MYTYEENVYIHIFYVRYVRLLTVTLACANFYVFITATVATINTVHFKLNFLDI